MVSEGSFAFAASGIGATSEAFAGLDFVGAGSVGGDAFLPIMEPLWMTVSGIVNVQGTQMPVEFIVDSTGLMSLPLEIYDASCESASESFTQTIAEVVSSAGGTGSNSGHWVGIRIGEPGDARTADTLQAYADLVDDLIKLKHDVNSGAGLSPAQLMQLADRAELLMATAVLNETCRNLDEGAGDTIFHASAVAGADLIQAALIASDTISLPAMSKLVGLGLRTGTLYANAPEGSTAYELDVQLHIDFEARLAQALGPPINTSDVQQIMLVALTMGWSKTAAQAAAAL